MVDLPKDNKTKEESKVRETQKGSGIEKPLIDGFKINGQLKGKLETVAKTLAAVSFLEVAPESDAVNVAYVESRDISNKPYLFSLIKIEKDEISVMYSIPRTIAPNKRKLDVIRQFLNILGLIESIYYVDNKSIYNLIEVSVKEVEKLIDKNAAKLYVDYDVLKKESDIMKRKVTMLEQESERLKTINYELKSSNDELTLKLNKYENVSDEVLRVKIQEWIKDHDGKINIPDFCSVYKTSESKVEEVLNELVTGGYLTAKK